MQHKSSQYAYKYALKVSKHTKLNYKMSFLVIVVLKQHKLSNFFYIILNINIINCYLFYLIILSDKSICIIVILNIYPGNIL